MQQIRASRGRLVCHRLLPEECKGRVVLDGVPGRPLRLQAVRNRYYFYIENAICVSNPTDNCVSDFDFDGNAEGTAKNVHGYNRGPKPVTNFRNRLRTAVSTGT
jgi:hypothetical protein